MRTKVQRQWLAPSDHYSNAYSVVTSYHGKDSPSKRALERRPHLQTHYNLDCSLAIADCNRIVTLQFDIYEDTVAAREKVRNHMLAKIRRLMDHCQAVEDALIQDADNNHEEYPE